MSFQTDTALAKSVGTSYGDYMSTFESEHRQVRADLFKQGSWLVAHVSFSPGFNVNTATDRYVSELQRFARERGYDGRVRFLLP